jgi:hypothetical protein
MAKTSHPIFPHRQNPDGTIDSICTGCYFTIATATSTAELEAAERAHDCKGFRLGEILHGRKE